jgi:hypothetical protein
VLTPSLGILATFSEGSSFTEARQSSIARATFDDYAVDPVERNDESFIFELKIRGTDILGIRLYPVEIGMCRAMLARGSARSAIIVKMEHLCSSFKTKILFDGGLGCLSIPR